MSKSKGYWRLRCPLPLGIGDAPAVTYDGRIFLFGGFSVSSRDPRNSVLEYSPESDSWSSKSPLRKARWGAAATLYDKKAYIFGGLPQTKAVEFYDLVDDRCRTLRNLPRELRSQGLMAATVESGIYVFSRWSTFEYDPVRDRYLPRSRAHVSRTWATCASVELKGENRIYVIGGFDSAISNATDLNYYYLPSTDRWIGPLTPAPYKAYGVTRDNPVWNNKVYYGFGHSDPVLFFSDVYAYDPASNAWTASGRGSFARDGVACGIVEGKLYVIGGRNNPDNPNAAGLCYNEELELRC